MWPDMKFSFASLAPIAGSNGKQDKPRNEDRLNKAGEIATKGLHVQ